jgi:hypothetical protein
VMGSLELQSKNIVSGSVRMLYAVIVYFPKIERLIYSIHVRYFTHLSNMQSFSVSVLQSDQVFTVSS